MSVGKYLKKKSGNFLFCNKYPALDALPKLTTWHNGGKCERNYFNFSALLFCPLLDSYRRYRLCCQHGRLFHKRVLEN